jgi:PAS domain S-box-containing protein
LGAIHSTYTSPDAPRQINLSHAHIKRISSDIKQVTQSTLPGLETIFQDAQEHVEKLLAGDIYPRFVKHQVTASATMALADHRERYQGLGDCFCITDPSKADNPILYASDGFVSVTGYTRKDIIPRNCRFLQGELTDSSAVKRLRASIDSCEETVELLLNYRKNGDPFWNLLYVAPLLDERGEVTFFLGGQINCSTTIHSCNDILRVLSVNDDELDQQDEMASMRSKPASIRSRSSGREGTKKTQSSFFKSWRKYNAPPPTSKISVRDEAGMEGELLHRVGKKNLKTQVEAFYTAYSKVRLEPPVASSGDIDNAQYLVMTWNPNTHALMIKHYSPGVIDMLCLNLPNGGIAPIYNKDIFKVLAEHSSSSSSSVAKTFRTTVRDALRTGVAVSVETGFLTGFEERKGAKWFGGQQEGLRRVEERYVTHWTPLKDEEGRLRMVVLTIAPKV